MNEFIASEDQCVGPKDQIKLDRLKTSCFFNNTSRSIKLALSQSPDSPNGT